MKSLRSILIFFLLLAGTATFAWSAQYDIKEMTPQIQAALAGRQSRYAELQSLKSQGALGENLSGYVEVLTPVGNAGSIASAENADRRIIYSAIVEQNNLGAQGLPQVQSVFSEVQRDKAKSGDFIQLPGGQWSQKS